METTHLYLVCLGFAAGYLTGYATLRSLFMPKCKDCMLGKDPAFKKLVIRSKILPLA